MTFEPPGHWQRWPESLFQTPTPLLFQNFWIQVRLFFKFENPTPAQTPATIIDPTVIYPCLTFRNDHTDSCYCRNGKLLLFAKSRNWKVTPDPGLVFHRILTPGPKEKRRILPESTPAIRIRSHLWSLVPFSDCSKVPSDAIFVSRVITEKACSINFQPLAVSKLFPSAYHICKKLSKQATYHLQKQKTKASKFYFLSSKLKLGHKKWFNSYKSSRTHTGDKKAISISLPKPQGH